MSAQHWPNNWPPLDTLRGVLGSHPEGCRRSNFEHLDAKRPAGIIAISGPGWINIRKRLLSLGVADLLADGSLVLAGKQPAATQPAAGAGYSAEQIAAALAEVWAENDAGDPAEITAQLLAKLGQPTAPTEPDHGPEPEDTRPPLSAAEQWAIAFAALPTSRETAITRAQWLRLVHSKGVEIAAVDSYVRNGIEGDRDIGFVRDWQGLPETMVWRDPNPKPRERTADYSRGTPNIGPAPKRSPEEEAAHQAKRERIERNLDPSNLADID